MKTTFREEDGKYIVTLLTLSAQSRQPRSSAFSTTVLVMTLSLTVRNWNTSAVPVCVFY